MRQSGNGFKLEASKPLFLTGYNKLRMHQTSRLSLLIVILMAFGFLTKGQNTITEVKQAAKISTNLNGFGSPLDNGDNFGRAITSIGDLNNDGVVDIAVGANLDDDGNTNAGAVYVLFLNADGSIKKRVKISSTSGNLGVSLDTDDNFGCSLTSIKDLNKDGTRELAVGAYRDDDGGTNRGAVYILYMDTTGSVKRTKKISDTQGSFSGGLANDDNFGGALTNLGDYDKDGVDELVVGAHGDDDGNTNHGAVYVLYLDTAATVKRHKKISDTQGNFGGTLDQDDFFGFGLSQIGDLNDDGVNDLAVGAMQDDDGGSDRGAIWIMFMDTSGTVKKYSKISSTLAGFNADIDNDDRFGLAITNPGDLDGDGIEDLAVGAFFDDDGGTNRGGFWLLYLDTSGGVTCYEKFSDTEGNFNAGLDNGDRFGVSLAIVGDLDKNGTIDLASGATFDDDGGADRGAYYFISLRDPELKILTNSGTFCQGTTIGLNSKDGKYVNWRSHNNKIASIDSFFTRKLSLSDTVFYFESGDFTAGCTAYDTLKLTITATTPLNFPSISVCGTQAVQLGPDTIPNRFSFIWSSDTNITDSTIANPYADVNGDTTLYVTVYDSNSNCTYTDSQFVKLDNCSSGNCEISTFQKTYGGTSEDVGHALIRTSDGKMVMAGYTKSYGNGGEDVFVMKLGTNGSVEWYKTYGGSGDDRAYQIIETRSGDLVVLGSTKSYGGTDEDLYLLRLSSTGTITWTKTIGGSDQDIGFGIVELPNGNFGIHHHTRSYSQNSFADMAVLEVSADGSQVSASKRMGATNNEGVGNMLLTSDRKYFTVGNTEISSIDAALNKVDLKGNLEWTRTYGGSGDDRFFQIIRTNDKKYAAVGYTTTYGAGKHDFFFVKFDDDGKVDFARAFGGSDDEKGYSLMQDAAGNYIIVGSTTSFGSGSTDILAVKMTSAGKLVWGRTFGGTGIDDTYRKSVNLVELNGGYAFSGYTTVGSNIQALLVSMNADGIASVCNTKAASVTITNLSISASNGASLSTASFAASSSSGGTTNTITTVTDSLYCDSFCVNFRNDTSCGNTPVKFTDLSSVNPTGWQWSVYDSTQKTSVTSTKQNPEFNLNPGQYYVTLTATNGVDTNALTKKVTVYFAPSYTRPVDTTLCFGDSLNVSLTGGNKITWWEDTTIARGAPFGRKVGPTTTTKYAFRVEDTTLLCGVDDTITVNIQALPIVNAGIDTAFCFGDSVQLNGTAPDSFFWTPNSNISKVDTLRPYVKPSSTVTYVLTSIDKLNCTSRDSVVVTTLSLPTADAGIDTTICLGDKAKLRGSGGVSFEWNTSATTPNIEESPNSNTKYWLTVKDAFGCESAADTVEVFVPALPVTTVSPNDTMCFGDSVQLSAGGGFKYDWSNGDTTTTTYVKPASTTNFTVQAISGNGCRGNSASVEVFVRAQIMATLSENDTICAGDTATLVATGGIKYTWSTGVAGDTVATVKVNPTTNTVYQMTAIDVNGCESSPLTVQVVVKAAPSSFAGDNDTICPGSIKNLIASGGDEFLWSNGATTSLVQVTPTTDTLFWVIASSNGCASVRDTVLIRMRPLPTMNLIGPDSICEFEDTFLKVETNATIYEWSTTETVDSIRIDPIKDTFYWAEVENEFGCVVRDTQFIHVNQKPVLSLLESDTACEDSDLELTVSGASRYLWEDGETNAVNTIKVANQDEYITVIGFSRDGCSSDPDSILIVSLEAPEPYLGEDQIICSGQTITLDGGAGRLYLWSTNETSKTIDVSPEKDSIFWVEVSNGFCYGERDSVNIQVREKTVVSLGPDLTLCFGDSLLLEAEVENGIGADIEYEWSTGDTTENIWAKPQVNTTYWVIASLAGECASEPDTLIMTVKPSPTAIFDVTKVRGTRPFNFNIHNQSTNTITSQWTIGDTVFEQNNPSFSVKLWRPASYRVTLVASNEFNCVDTAHFDSVFVFERLFTDFWPTAFTPNGDEVNDSFSMIRFDLTGIEKLEGKIFNRWGEEVYYWTGQDWWDGTFKGEPCQVGVYVYVINVWDAVGERRQLTGNVTLVR